MLGLIRAAWQSPALGEGSPPCAKNPRSGAKIPWLLFVLPSGPNSPLFWTCFSMAVATPGLEHPIQRDGSQEENNGFYIYFFHSKSGARRVPGKQKALLSLRRLIFIISLFICWGRAGWAIQVPLVEMSLAVARLWKCRGGDGCSSWEVAFYNKIYKESGF